MRPVPCNRGRSACGRCKSPPAPSGPGPGSAPPYCPIAAISRRLAPPAAIHDFRMLRRPRIEFPEAIHHVTMQGVNRSAIFRDDIDRWAFEQLLEAACKKHRWRCLAYCLMGNQIQLVIKTLAPNLSHGMRFLSSAYVRRHHGRHRASGPLFQGGYRSLLVHRDAYLLEVVRYVLLNPVRAGLCLSPADWRWSSARAALRLRPTPTWADFTIIYELLGPLDGQSPQRLQQFLRDGYAEVPGTCPAPLGY